MVSAYLWISGIAIGAILLWGARDGYHQDIAELKKANARLRHALQPFAVVAALPYNSEAFCDALSDLSEDQFRAARIAAAGAARCWGAA